MSGSSLVTSFFLGVYVVRLMLQRVLEASVSVAEKVVGEIGPGLLVFLGIHQDDQEKDIHYLADKLLALRIFADAEGRMNRSVLDVEGGILVVSQFTLYGDCRKGRRPSFDRAAEPEMAKSLYVLLLDYLRKQGITPQQGVFGAYMQVRLVNDGPVTFLLDSSKEAF